LLPSIHAQRIISFCLFFLHTQRIQTGKEESRREERNKRQRKDIIVQVEEKNAIAEKRINNQTERQRKKEKEKKKRQRKENPPFQFNSIQLPSIDASPSIRLSTDEPEQ